MRGAVLPGIAVDRASARPLHGQIYDQFRSMILKGALQLGKQVPSSRALSVELGISRIPVVNAYEQLLAEGYFESRSGAGTFVSLSLPDQPIDLHLTEPQPNNGTVAGSVSRLAQCLPVGRAPWRIGPGAFSVGQLAFDHFPYRIWSDLVARHARKVRASQMNYSDPMGALPFREAIAGYLRSSRAVHCDASQIMVVSGSQQALDIAARVLLDPETPVWVEEPGYELMQETLKLAGCTQVPVPVDADGLNVVEGIKLCPHARAAFVTPSHQYPLGSVMSATRRLQLLDWAHTSHAWIVEDDYDSEYRYESQPIASLQGLDRGSRVIYIGTFSKTLFPSLRLGYLVIPPSLVERFGAVRRACDLCPPYLNQAAMADFLEEGHFARHIRKTRIIYSERRRALLDALRNEFGNEVEILGADAGLFLALLLPDAYTDVEITKQAAKEELWLWPLSLAYQGRNKRQGFILGFGGTKAEDMAHHVRRLRKVIRLG